MSELRLTLRTPHGVLLDRPVRAIRAEDVDGWFGVLPGRADLVAVLEPGLMVVRDAEGECFVASAGGMMDLRGPWCRVMLREAVASRDLASIGAELEGVLARRARRGHAQQQAMSDLVREALRRLARERGA